MPGTAASSDSEPTGELDLAFEAQSGHRRADQSSIGLIAPFAGDQYTRPQPRVRGSLATMSRNSRTNLSGVIRPTKPITGAAVRAVAAPIRTPNRRVENRSVDGIVDQPDAFRRDAGGDEIIDIACAIATTAFAWVSRYFSTSRTLTGPRT